MAKSAAAPPSVDVAPVPLFFKLPPAGPFLPFFAGAGPFFFFFAGDSAASSPLSPSASASSPASPLFFFFSRFFRSLSLRLASFSSRSASVAPPPLPPLLADPSGLALVFAFGVLFFGVLAFGALAFGALAFGLPLALVLPLDPAAALGFELALAFGLDFGLAFGLA